MRRVIATRLAESIGPIPTFYLTVEIEMDNTLSLRKQINDTIPEDQKISVNDIVVKAAAMASMRHPFVNSSYQDKTIRFYEQADVGVAVAIEEGLITPVIRGANLKGFGQIAAEIKELGRARQGEKAAARGIHRRDILDQQSGNVRDQGIYRDHQPARGRDPGDRRLEPDAGRTRRRDRRPEYYECDDVVRSPGDRRRDRREIPADIQANARKPGDDAALIIVILGIEDIF